MSFERRYGKFKITKSVIEQHHEAIQAVMSTIIPIRAEYMWEDGCIHYDAWSTSFDIVPEGQLLPHYLPHINVAQRQLVKWERLE